MSTTIATAGGAPVREFLLIRFGHVQVDRALSGQSFVFTRAHAQQAVQWFARLGRKLIVDYEHQALGQKYNPRADQLTPAAGWVSRLEVRRDGLWCAGVEWTARARQLIAGGEYRHFSPVIQWAGRYGDDLSSLGPVALTNNPAMRRAPALAATQDRRPFMSAHKTILSARPLPLARGAGSHIAKMNPDPMNSEDADSEVVLSGETLALLSGFFGYAFDIVPLVKEFLNKSDLVDKEAWIRGADALRNQAAPGLVGGVIELIELLGEIEEHRILYEDVAEDVTGGPVAGAAPPGVAARRGGRSAAVLAREASADGRVFAGSRALQAEFKDAATFIAFRKAERAGLVRIKTGIGGGIFRG